MATCKLCGKSRWFQRLSKEGLCKDCRPGYVEEMRRRAARMGRYAEAIEHGENLDAIIENLNLGIKNFEELRPYEDKGIFTTKPPPSECISNWTAKKTDVVVSTFTHFLSEARDDARDATTLEARVGPLTQLAEGLAKYESELADPEALDPLKLSVRTEIAVQTADFHAGAAKAVEERDKAAALDHYRKALAALRADGIDAAAQEGRIAEIESRIAALGAAPAGQG